MNDRPTAPELLEAVRLFLEKELLPALTDARLRFQALVAANVLSVAGRELAGEEAQLLEEMALLAALLGDEGEVPAGLQEQRRWVRARNEELCARIRGGAFDDVPRWREAVAAVRRLVVRKLEIANPRYLQSVQNETRAG